MHVTSVRPPGFTLIELLVTLAIAALLVVLATPSAMVWLADGQIRAGAQNVAAGLQLARAQALKRNENVQLVLDPTTKTGGWAAQLVSDGSTLETGVFLEGADRPQFTILPGGSNTVTFTGLGQIAAANADATLPFASVVVALPAVAGSRSLTVMVHDPASPAIIKLKICDHQWDSPPRPAPDPKGCLP